MNVLWIIGCSPIVTVGASTIALYYCAEKYRVNDAVNLLRTFWNAYRSNLKQSFALMGIMLLVTGIFAADFIFLYRIEFEIPEVILSVIGVALLLNILAMGYIFLLQAHFDNTVRKTTINAVLMSILHLPKSLLVAILNLLPIGLLFYLTDGFLPFAIIWLFADIASTSPGWAGHMAFVDPIPEFIGSGDIEEWLNQPAQIVKLHPHDHYAELPERYLRSVRRYRKRSSLRSNHRTSGRNAC